MSAKVHRAGKEKAATFGDGFRCAGPVTSFKVTPIVTACG
jgi:hypothetical protein